MGVRGPSGAGGPPRGGGISRRRRAHTLVELILVLSILAILAVVVIPRMITALIGRRMDAAMDALRSDLTYARARAVSTGLRHQFVIDPSSGEIAVQAYHPELAASQSSQAGQDVQPVVHQDQIPSETRVATWTVFPLVSGATDATSGGAAPDGTPLVFYPEGTSDSAQIVIEDQTGTQRGLVVDGFTGEIRELDASELGKQ